MIRFISVQADVSPHFITKADPETILHRSFFTAWFIVIA